jgi:hypothetical protein
LGLPLDRERPKGSAPDKAWYFDETVYQFGANKSPNAEPISQRASVVPNEEGAEAGTHWLRDAR